MEIIPKSLLLEMASYLSEEEAAEMAIPSYLHKNPLMRWMANRRIRTLIEWLNIYKNPFGAALDYGCGVGILFQAASAAFQTVYGVDLVLKPAEMLIAAYDLKNVELLPPDSMKTKIEDASIEVIICGEVLEHIQDISSILNEFRRVSKPDAHLLVTLPTENLLYRFGRKLSGFEGDYHLLDARKIHERITRANFKFVQRKYIPLYGPCAIYWALDYIHTKS
ncbi:MAG: class I SAM-dependent methyltransferase [Chloroflexi bacterium]|nr:class I SAM-dependent methyltransferase [Chloroflexota bacterium]